MAESSDKPAEEYNVIAEILADRYRATIIIPASRVDDKLGKLLAKVLLVDPSKEAEIFGAEKELGSFASKIKFAQVMGISHGVKVPAVEGTNSGRTI